MRRPRHSVTLGQARHKHEACRAAPGLSRAFSVRAHAGPVGLARFDIYTSMLWKQMSPTFCSGKRQRSYKNPLEHRKWMREGRGWSLHGEVSVDGQI